MQKHVGIVNNDSIEIKDIIGGIDLTIPIHTVTEFIAWNRYTFENFDEFEKRFIDVKNIDFMQKYFVPYVNEKFRLFRAAIEYPIHCDTGRLFPVKRQV